MKKLFLLAALFVSSTLAFAVEETPAPFAFYKNGKLVKQLSLKEMDKAVGQKKVNTIEPHDGSRVTYLGYSFTALLEAVYGKNWKAIKKYNFKCLDGYNPQVNTAKFLKHDSYLVFAKEGASDFKLQKNNEGGKVVDMRPYYLTWDAIKAPELAANLYDRPYQLVSVDVVLP